METTPNYAFPYPEPEDPADAPSQLRELALALDTALQAAVPIGAVSLWATATAPANWLPCNGGLVAAADYPALAIILGSSGGQITLPDLRDRVPIGASSGKPIATTGGAEGTVLNETQIPSHTHGATGAAGAVGAHSHGGSVGATNTDHLHAYTAPGGGASFSTGSGTPVTRAVVGGGAATGGMDRAAVHSHTIAADGSHSHSISVAVAAAGGGQAHSNMQPWLAMAYIIRAK